ncbi:MAG: DMT family transporter [Microcystaceae cyanobacterium]
MKAIPVKISQTLSQVPSSVYLWTAILIFAASNSITRKIIEIGERHLVNGRNPISLCNVLFVGNICAFLVMVPLFYQEWQLPTLKRLTRGDWMSLTVIGILSGALGPALIFAALDQTNVTNVVLISRLEPPITLALSVWLLGARVNAWTIAGSLVAFAGVAITAFLGSSGQMIAMMGGIVQLGQGELLVGIGAVILAVATVISKLRLQAISLGIFSIFRTVVGTVVFFVLANALYGSNHFAEAFSPFLWGWMLIYAAVIVVAGQLCWFAGLRSSTSTEVSLANSFNPIAAIAMAYLILGEVPSAAQYLGGVIILIGIVLSLIGNLRQTKTPLRPARLDPANAMGMASGFRGI